MKSRSEVEKLVGVTRRTLQEYDKIGLLHPSKKNEYGYWFYDNDAIQKLFTIQIFVEAKYERTEIKRIMSLPDDDLMKEYDRLIAKMQEKRSRIDGMISYLKTTRRMMELPQESLNALAKMDPATMFREKNFRDTMEASFEMYSEIDADEDGSILILINLIGLLSSFNTRDSEAPEIQKFIAGTIRQAAQLLATETAESSDTLEEGDYIKLALDIVDELTSDSEITENIDRQFGTGTFEFVRTSIARYKDTVLTAKEGENNE